MNNDERFLRQEIMSALDKNKVKSINSIELKNKELAVDEGIRRWREGGINGREAIEHAIKYARSNFKRTGR